MIFLFFFFFSSRRRHTRSLCDWSSDVCSSDLGACRVIRRSRVCLLRDDGERGRGGQAATSEVLRRRRLVEPVRARVRPDGPGEGRRLPDVPELGGGRTVPRLPRLERRGPGGRRRGAESRQGAALRLRLALLPRAEDAVPAARQRRAEGLLQLP